ncbi:putative Transcriptional regulator (ManR) [Oenococcus oeni]|nr:putative Transcriptional regulator (ManR) [Oenococcus oeni]SYV99328.1 putative Transcriptional regulator (ManR) [Oenococcus oeni]SYW18154.1 putative Transcriptional regulator (ManR) [Oenococcus oeni]VDC15255.1 putative Transcriptional regulator (ManR) [Oenococcus oeni]
MLVYFSIYANESVYNNINCVKKEVIEINDQELSIAKLFLNQEIVHYSDIAEMTGKSKRTIYKYLNTFSHLASGYGLKLVRKRNVGLYLDGNVSDLRDAIENGSLETGTTRNQRITSLLSKLLLSKKPLAIQELADSFFVSRSTFESDLNSVKKILEEYHAVIANSNKGIFIRTNERNRRALMSKLLNMYWGQTAYLDKHQERIEFKIEMPNNISTNLFNSDTLKEVIKVVDKFKKISSIKFSDYEYQSLTIHLVIALERIKNNEVLRFNSDKEPLLENTKLLVSLLEKEFAIKIPIDEQEYINIHIMAVEGPRTKITVQPNQKPLTAESEMEQFLRNNIDEYDSILIKNLLLHLIPALKRLKLGLKLRNPYTENIKRFFPLAYNRSVDLGLKIKNEFKVEVPDNELAFIALHMEAFIERSEKFINVVLICSTGLGSARLLEQRIKNRFANKIHINRVISLQELKEKPVTEDLVISTINIKLRGVPAVIVSPFLDEKGSQKIERIIDNLSSDYSAPKIFSDLLNSDLIFVDSELSQRDDIIRFLGQKLEQTGYVKAGIVEAAVRREKLASTATEMVAIPHAPIEFVNRPCVAVFVNSKGIDWDNNYVNIVFFLAMNEDIKTFINEIYGSFNNILENKHLLNQIVRAKDSEEILQLLGGEVKRERND